MAYTINKYNGEQLVVLEDGTIDTSTSLGLVGRNYVGYGETQNENFVFLLENFANDAAPSKPLKGQIWYNTETKLAYIFDGAVWSLIGAAVLSATPPENPSLGSLWLKTPVNTLNIWTGTEWNFIGPEAAPGFGTTRFRSSVIKDSDNNDRPVILLEINGTIFAVCTAVNFTINPSNSIPNLSNNLIAGINLITDFKINGSITGNAGSASRLESVRLINGVAFDGQQNITVKASTTNRLIKGSYLTGSNFDGSQEVTLDVDATSANVIGKVVARNSSGGFAAGTITADLVGSVTGDVNSTGTSNFNIVTANQFVGATLSGNAFSASQLQTPRRINGVSFDGTRDITVSASAATLTGNTLNSSVLISGLTQVGTLTNLSTANEGISVGTGGQLRFLIDGGTPTVRSATGQLNFDIGVSGPDISFINATASLALGGPNAPAVIGDNTTNLGINGYKFNNIYANNFLGNASSATTAVTSSNLSGGAAGAVPYQTSANTTAMLGIGAEGSVLTVQSGVLAWAAVSRQPLRKGTYLNLTTPGAPFTPYNSYDGLVDLSLSVDADSNNVANKVVARDSSGNFAAGTITANLTGNVSGNAATATSLQTARTINGVAFNGTANITITATDPTKVASAGDAMSGYLTLNADPVNPLHAAPKQYVDSRLPQYTFVTGNTVYSTSGFTNEVGSWNNSANYFDVFPPAGKTMGNLVSFVPSIAVIHYAGGVDSNDSLRCTWGALGDRIRVWVQNTEQRSTPAANYLAIWS